MNSATSRFLIGASFVIYMPEHPANVDCESAQIISPEGGHGTTMQSAKRTTGLTALSAVAALWLGGALTGDVGEWQRFDTEHVELAIDYLSQPSVERLTQMAATAAAQHLLKHSAVTGYYPIGITSVDITRDLLGMEAEAGKIEQVRRLLTQVRASPDRQRNCLADAAAYLPDGFRFAEPLYVTWGYDIGVSMNGSASINLAHSKFAGDSEEIWWYCTHEMHHAGFTTLQPYPRAVSEIATSAQMLEFIRYSTMLEGMAVHAAREPRRKAGALDGDPDYLALGNAARMAAYEQAYWEIYRAFEAAGDRPLNERDWESIEGLSDGDRLWYRVGALMAEAIESAEGRATLRELPWYGPDAFFALYSKTDRTSE